jgi:hypothetical protein
MLRDKGRQVWCVRPGDKVYDAIKMMADKDVGSLIVLNGSKIVGIVNATTPAAWEGCVDPASQMKPSNPLALAKGYQSQNVLPATGRAPVPALSLLSA